MHITLKINDDHPHVHEKDIFGHIPTTKMLMGLPALGQAVHLSKGLKRLYIH